jgi:hypothetical protein
MNLSHQQRKLLNRLRDCQRAGGLTMKWLSIRLAILFSAYAAVAVLALVGFDLWLDRVAPGQEDLAFRRAVTAFFYIPFSGAVALVGGGLWVYASYSLLMTRSWPVLSEIIDWRRVDALLEPPASAVMQSGQGRLDS